jgi:hypothetical protein
LWYLPLAIIQAGAFISKSGALDSYLALYAKNRDRLLREKPAQSHDDYAWTVSQEATTSACPNQVRYTHVQRTHQRTWHINDHQIIVFQAFVVNNA